MGTTIVIETSSDNYNKLIDSDENDTRPHNWGWYLFDKPFISRTLEVDNSVFDANLHRYQRRIEENDFFEDDYSEEDYYSEEETTVAEKNIFDVNNEANNWRKINSEFSYSIYWKHREIKGKWYRVSLKNKNHLYEGGLLICNGFFVCKENNTEHTRTSSRIPKANLQISQDNVIHFSFPHISILDPNGDFPISLRRDGLTLHKYPFESYSYWLPLPIRLLLLKTVKESFRLLPIINP
ncbi:MAG: hypothetical protein EOP45_13785 [Sphingobacteriaceae bacterium]|nr:MAG: hypothetical protein EOP45_13785 [Sphingobacteriaceae bacterium]